MHPITSATLRANRLGLRLAAISGAEHVRITLRPRSKLANWSRLVLGLFDAHGWEA